MQGNMIPSHIYTPPQEQQGDILNYQQVKTMTPTPPRHLCHICMLHLKIQRPRTKDCKGSYISLQKARKQPNIWHNTKEAFNKCVRQYIKQYTCGTIKSHTPGKKILQKQSTRSCKKGKKNIIQHPKKSKTSI